MKNYFTKSMFKLALECPTSMYYAAHPDQYANSANDDEFLKALAEGGFQVGELAKIYENIDEDLCRISDEEIALQRTEDLLKRDEVTIAEAAFAWENCFVRTDIIRKRGMVIELIEVKAKSFNDSEESMMGKKQPNKIISDWVPYLYDVAFQKYILSKAMPSYEIHAYLMMADKTQVVDIEGMNKLFEIKHYANGRPFIAVSPKANDIIKASKSRVLTAFDVDDIVNRIIAGETGEQEEIMNGNFVQFVDKMRDAWNANKRLTPTLSNQCIKCTFCGKGLDNNLCDGHDECWLEVAGLKPSETSKPLVTELNGTGIASKREDWIKNRRYCLDQLTFLDIEPKSSKKKTEVPQNGLPNYLRQWLHITIATNNAEGKAYFGDDLQGDIYLDKEGLREEMRKWGDTIHMIDFETSSPAIPFYKGLKPYEEVAFQFSHHIIKIQPDGSYTIYHAGQWLNEDVSEFPNFKFVHELKRQLSQDDGKIFRYSHHENTILNAIQEQLESSNEPDKEELIEFINTITHGPKKRPRDGGPRDMIDLCEIVKRYFYCYSQMHGSNSIKQVLPAVLNSSHLLQKKYSQPIYGSEIPSLNVSKDDSISLITRLEDGSIDNPYHHLPSIATYLGISEDDFQKLLDVDTDDMEIANGGAALTAYNMMMFCQGKEKEQAIRKALLRYCELDTMAMVFIWEYFYNVINNSEQ